LLNRRRVCPPTHTDTVAAVDGTLPSGFDQKSACSSANDEARRILDVCAADLQEEMAEQRFSVPSAPTKTAATKRTSQRAEASNETERDARAALEKRSHAYGVDRVTVERAHAGDEQAFRDLTDPYRRELLAHCYRMLGSLTDAEDMLQETLLAAWRGLAGFEGRSSVRSWLYRIATNTCLNAIRAGARRIPSEPRPPFQPPEPTQRDEIRWLQPYPDTLLEGIPDTAPGPEARYSQTEAIELAFVAGLQRMPPRQAATVLLRDVLGFGTEEVAALLGTSQTAVKGTLQRGRAALESSRDRTDSRQLPPRVEERNLARRFADAYVTTA
jgi:RNA polymerase sigma factor (sigma-70 family)